MISKEVAVIGAGPAGLNAAIEAARLGAEVVLIDENLKLGGQLTKQIHKFFGSEQHGAGTRGIDIAEQLIDEALGQDVAVVDRTIDVHVAALRKKLGSGAGWIQTIRGAGYTWRPPSDDDS